MDIFDSIGKKASEAYKYTADKTEKIAKETKIKFKINELKNQIEDLYTEIGKKVYEKNVREENIEIKDDLEELCTKINVLSDQIEVLLKESLELKDKKQCKQCYTEINKEDKFCKNCGAKQSNDEELDKQDEDFKEEIVNLDEIDKDNSNIQEVVNEQELAVQEDNEEELIDKVKEDEELKVEESNKQNEEINEESIDQDE